MESYLDGWITGQMDEEPTRLKEDPVSPSSLASRDRE